MNYKTCEASTHINNRAGHRQSLIIRGLPFWFTRKLSRTLPALLNCEGTMTKVRRLKLIRKRYELFYYKQALKRLLRMGAR